LTRYYALAATSEVKATIRRALRPFHIDVDAGGVKGNFLGIGPFYEEYPTSPRSHVLNGCMFALIGLKDVAEVVDTKEADYLFFDVFKTLERVISFYDLKDISAYDAMHFYRNGGKPLFRKDYHIRHISLADVLHLMTGSQVMKEIADRWLSYCQGNVSYHRIEGEDLQIDIDGTDLSVGDSIEIALSVPKFHGETMEYAFAEILDGFERNLRMFEESPVLKWRAPKAGVYQLVGFVRDKFGNRVRRRSHRITVKP
jgi:hypothetical protein